MKYDPIKNRLYQKSYALKYPEKIEARNILTKAVRSGKIIRQPCDVPGCRNTLAEAHHQDYSRPLDVRWLCVKHHREYHNTGTIKPMPIIPIIEKFILSCGHDSDSIVSSRSGMTHYCSECERLARLDPHYGI